jgi:hypothetical protein
MKLKLQLEDLRIDSFTTTPVEKAKGTVFGEQCTCYTQCTCPGCPTCDASCNGTCAGTCGASCNGTCNATNCGTCDYACESRVQTCNGSCHDTCNLYSACGPYDCL